CPGWIRLFVPNSHNVYPLFLTRTEVRAILARMSGTYGLMANLLYGTGMRLMECVRLRVKDVDFERRAILMRDGKEAKDRITLLPESLADPLQAHLLHRRMLFDDDSRLESVLKLRIPGQPSRHKLNHGGVNEGQSGFRETFKIL